MDDCGAIATQRRTSRYFDRKVGFPLPNRWIWWSELIFLVVRSLQYCSVECGVHTGCGASSRDNLCFNEGSRKESPATVAELCLIQRRSSGFEWKSRNPARRRGFSALFTLVSHRRRSLGRRILSLKCSAPTGQCRTLPDRKYFTIYKRTDVYWLASGSTYNVGE